MPTLAAHIVFDHDVHGWEPAGLALVDFTQQNPMLDVQRRILSEEFPRRKFETALSITVGGLRADTGTYYTGRDRPAGIARLAELQGSRKLGVVNGHHLLAVTSGGPGAVGMEGTAVTVEARFSRPRVVEWPATAWIFAQVWGARGERWIEELTTAAWETFRYLVRVAPVRSATASWTDFEQSPDAQGASRRTVPAFVLVPEAMLVQLGGPNAVVERLGAIDAHVVDGASGGLVVQLARRPEDVTAERIDDVCRRLHLVPDR